MKISCVHGANLYNLFFDRPLAKEGKKEPIPHPMSASGEEEAKRSSNIQRILIYFLGRYTACKSNVVHPTLALGIIK
jgi:hypothetical protein